MSRAPLLLTGEGDRPTSQLYLWVPYGEPALGRRGVRTHRYTLSVEKTMEGELSFVLHDNVEDPFQLLNLASEEPETVQIFPSKVSLRVFSISSAKYTAP